MSIPTGLAIQPVFNAVSATQVVLQRPANGCCGSGFVTWGDAWLGADRRSTGSHRVPVEVRQGV
jgi:hypothetical protein